MLKTGRVSVISKIKNIEQLESVSLAKMGFSELFMNSRDMIINIKVFIIY